ncbi:MAG: thioredoxin-like domain-containing protein [Halobacteriales archaeon]
MSNAGDVHDRSRRDVLGVVAGAGVVSLSGCLGAVGGGSSGDTDDGTGSGTLEFDTLDVGGSPGNVVPLRASDRLSLVDFFATYCAPCKPQMGRLGAVRRHFESEQLHMLSLTNESDADPVRQFWRDQDGAWPVALDTDSEAIERFAVRGIPTLVLLDPDGEELWRHTGLAETAAMKREIEAALNE